MTVEQPTTPALVPTHGEGANPNPKSALQQTATRRWPKWLARAFALVLILGVCGGAAWYWGIREPEPKDDFGRFQGEWIQTFGEQDVNARTEKSPAVAVRITGDIWQFLVDGREKNSFRMSLSETASPKEIELTRIDSRGNPIGEYRSHGIYTIDRKTARIIVAPVNLPRPMDFDNPDSVVWVLTRVKLELPTEHR
jgi:uncharacterized protein (TIGR03067 family)